MTIKTIPFVLTYTAYASLNRKLVSHHTSHMNKNWHIPTFSASTVYVTAYTNSTATALLLLCSPTTNYTNLFSWKSLSPVSQSNITCTTNHNGVVLLRIHLKTDKTNYESQNIVIFAVVIWSESMSTNFTRRSQLDIWYKVCSPSQ